MACWADEALKRDRATGLINFVKLGRGTRGSLVVGIR